MIVKDKAQPVVEFYLEDDEEASLGEGAAVDGHALAGDDLDVVMLGDVAGRRLDLLSVKLAALKCESFQPY
jgi:hypothetical protein